MRLLNSASLPRPMAPVVTPLMTLSFLLVFSALSTTAGAQNRPVLEPLHFPFETLGKSSYKLTPAFPALQFRQALFITPVPGHSNLLAVLEKEGRVLLVDKNSPGKTHTLLDISSQVITISPQHEEGLLGLAFAPDFPQSKVFFAYYSPKDNRTEAPTSTTLVQFSAEYSGGTYTAVSGSEKRLLTIAQPDYNHNGGMLAFEGQDLYVGIGDGGGWNDANNNWDKDPGNNGQNRATYLASILRIRPDYRGSYSIPESNPFVNDAGALKEIFAFGIRNPWRFSFDRLSKKLWLGDVGQDHREEISVVESGDNLGWSIYEGDIRCPGCDRNQTLVGGVHKEPVYAYNTGVGKSIVGGYVYRGEKFPELWGQYIFGDYISNKIWKLDGFDGEKASGLSELTNVNRIVSFGEDHDGELYVISIYDGIFKLERGDGENPKPLPQKLSQTGLFKDTKNLVPQSGLIEYTVNSPLWSDDAKKKRFFALPNGQRAVFHANKSWEFPNNSVFVKHFELPSGPDSIRRLETRVLIFANQTWTGFTYVWDESQEDATLQLEEKHESLEVWEEATRSYRNQTWQHPSQNQCMMCHSQASGVALGVSTKQLNKDDQLLSFYEMQLLSGFDPSKTDELPKLVNPYDSTQDIHQRAKSYLHTQCFHCHMPGGATPSGMDLRYESPVENLFVEPLLGSSGIADAQLIYPGVPEKSMIFHRFTRAEPAIAMPALGTSVVDEDAKELLRRWILQL